MGAPFPFKLFQLHLLQRGRFIAGAHLGALVLVLLCALAGFATSAHAQEALPAEGEEADQRRVFLPAIADSYVSNLNTASNFGSEPSLVVASGGTLATVNQPVLVRWDLSVFPLGTTVHAATMRLYQTGTSGTTDPWTLPLSYITANWSEATVNYDNRPSSVSTGVSVVSPAQSGMEIDTDVTNLVQAWQSGTPPNYGLYINAPFIANPHSRAFDSREATTTTQRPMLVVDYTLPAIRVCFEQNDTCPIAPNSIVHNLTTGARYSTDANGYMSAADVESVALGDYLWARMPITSSNGGTLYATQGISEVVSADAFFAVVGNGGSSEMRLVVEEDRPLWVQDLDISAQWYVRGNVEQATKLRDDILATSDYLHAFTDGQFVLGTVRVYQNYDQWGEAGMQLYANNTLRPRAIIGGVADAETPDFNPAIPITYTPGVISMGSYWNRFGTPPNSVNTQGGVPVLESEMEQDWALALGHELGHWLLYLFDTYTGVDGNASAELAELCTGTAMGNVYLPSNHGYIFSPDDWVTLCGETEAFAALGGRTEWETIQGWYTWATIPESFVADDYAPPAPITQVVFVAPSIPPGDLAAQLFNLDYQDDELSSGEARAFLIRNERVLEQGKPAKNSTQVQLTGAEVGDLLCVYDINDHAEGVELPRHQFGCETIAAGDDTLVMTKDVLWSPEVALTQVGPDQVQVVVHANANGEDSLTLRLFPEHESGMTPVVLPLVGNVYSATITLPASVPPLYAQVFVNESPAAPQTRREVMVDRGTGGGGAFGPARFYGDVLVMSSDGNASYQNSDLTELNEGESIAFQSMPGTPPLPFPLRIIGQSYRLDAFPISLVTSGTVSLRFTDADLVAAGAGAAGAGDPPAIWFWDGTFWSPLETSVIAPVNGADGVRVATAPSSGVGVYAVLIPAEGGSNRFLPIVAH